MLEISCYTKASVSVRQGGPFLHNSDMKFLVINLSILDFDGVSHNDLWMKKTKKTFSLLIIDVFLEDREKSRMYAHFYLISRKCILVTCTA